MKVAPAEPERPAPFKLPDHLRAPCDGCGKLKTRAELVVRGIYAYCNDCDPGEPNE